MEINLTKLDSEPLGLQGLSLPTSQEFVDLYIIYECFLQRFAAVIMRIREPKTTALIFASGKMVSFFLHSI